MNATHNNTAIFILLMFINIPTLNNAMEKKILERSIIKDFLHAQAIETIRDAMDEIEHNKLGYADYSRRTGLIWSDVLVRNADPAEIIKEYKTTKVTEIEGELKEHQPQSILHYASLRSIVSHHILPKMFETVRTWTDLPETLFAQIFFQRCSTSEAMDWHQDPGEDYTPQANYSLVFMLSERDDPHHGWAGGEFKIRSGLPKDPYEETDVETMIPRYNQAIIFNNQTHSHATTEIIPKAEKSKRDIIVIPIQLTTMPTKKEK